MIDTWVSRLREPRFGMVFVSAVIALMMAVHWTPMALPGLAVTGLAVFRPRTAARPVVWWVMAGMWFVASIVAQDRMEDHVHLFAVWLVALAVSLSWSNDAEFIEHAARQARVLIGVTFSAAVAWKLFFGEYLTGTTLRVFILVDSRFEPLAKIVGLSGKAIEQDRADLAHVLDGTVGTMSLEEPSTVMRRLMAVAVLTLGLEAVIAVSHLVPDSSSLAAVRLPAVVLFGVVTYAVVPVLLFAALLSVLAMAAARWRRDVLWVFPAMVTVSLTRLILII